MNSKLGKNWKIYPYSFRVYLWKVYLSHFTVHNNHPERLLKRQDSKRLVDCYTKWFRVQHALTQLVWYPCHRLGSVNHLKESTWVYGRLSAVTAVGWLREGAYIQHIPYILRVSHRVYILRPVLSVHPIGFLGAKTDTWIRQSPGFLFCAETSDQTDFSNDDLGPEAFLWR